MKLRLRIPRRWLQMGLRSLLAAVLVLCVVLAAWSNQARRQEEFVRRVVTLGGGYVQYEHELDTAGKRMPGAVSPAPAWLRRQIGDHFFFRIQRAGGAGLRDEDLELLSGFTSIEMLQLDERVTDEGLSHLSGLTNLKTLDLESPKITDQGLAHLSRLSKMEFLGLSMASVTDEGLKHLAGLKSLTFVALSETQVTAEGAAWLKRKLPNAQIEPTTLPSADEEREAVRRLVQAGARFHADPEGYVDELSFYDSSVTADALLPAASLTRLEQLSLHNSRVATGGIERLRQTHPHLRVLPVLDTPQVEEAAAVTALHGYGARLMHHADGYVRHVMLIDEELGDAALAPLANLTRLQGAEIFCTQITNQGLRQLEGIQGLQSLWIPRATLSNSGLQAFKKLTNLNSLWLQGSEITDQGLGHLAGLVCMRKLVLRGTRITGPGLAHLKDMSDLEELDLSGGSLRDEGLLHLNALPKLKRLWINLCDVSDAGMQHLAAHQGLEFLSLKETRITDAGLEHLQSLPKLKLLQVEHTRVTADGVQRFVAEKPNCKVRQ